MPLIATRGAASAQGFGEFAQQTAATYIEDVFSTYLYTGNSSTQTITNGIDLSGKGGMTWIKCRGLAKNNWLFDTARGSNSPLSSNNTNSVFGNVTSFFAGGPTPYFVAGSSGFTLDNQNELNFSGTSFASWTFRKQPKFFDVVTYTGNGANRTISHNLGSTPGCIIVKRTDTTGNWQVYHRSLTSAAYSIQLNLSGAQASATTVWNSTAPTSTVFSVGTDSTVNANGGTYVAYLFAHDAGGFGLSGSDNVISCGSITLDGSGGIGTVTLGYEPQWILIKCIDQSGNWILYDTMRQLSLTEQRYLYPDSASAEGNYGIPSDYAYPTATGFAGGAGFGPVGIRFIYIAIRRGPMKTPTSGTSVYANFYSNYSEGNILTSNFPVDLSIWKGNTAWDWSWDDRLRGTSTATNTGRASLASNSAAYENNGWAYLGAALFDNNTGVSVSYKASSSQSNQASYSLLRRAPSFFDEVCYTGTGVGATAYSHNLTTTPDFVLYKRRDSTGDWACLAKKANNNYQALTLNTTDNGFQIGDAVSCGLSNTTFKPADYSGNFNISTATYVAYLFATCAGVSKVGSYTGTGALQTVNCGFTGGARFVLIKRTDSTGDWYVYTSAQGISSGNDPYSLMNSTAALNTGTNYVDTTSVGFQVTAAAPAGLNANGGTYIFLAIA